MKLRIKGSSIRLRLTKSEVAQIKKGETVFETLSFSGSSRLRYALEPSREIKTLQAIFDGETISIVVPYALAVGWASGDEVSIKNHAGDEKAETMSPGKGPFILIEKDFFCLKPRVHEVEDESDMFDNPNEAHGSCG